MSNLLGMRVQFVEYVSSVVGWVILAKRKEWPIIIKTERKMLQLGWSRSRSRSDITPKWMMAKLLLYACGECDLDRGIQMWCKNWLFSRKKKHRKRQKVAKKDEQNRQGTIKRNEEKNRTQIWLTRSIGKEDASRREKK